MKRNLYLYKLAVLLKVFIFSSVSMYAGDDHEARKTITKDFDTDKSTQLEISNRYGKIDVKTWDKPSVRITATVIVKASSKSKAEDRLKEIATEITRTGNNISAVTVIGESGSSWWTGWWGSNSNVNMEINYDVFMPAYLRIILENKYGNIFLTDLSGKTSINLKYGNLYGRDIRNDLLMDIAYGKATIGETNNLSGTLSYSDYLGKKSNVVLLTTKYSKVQLDELTSITANSKYDTYKLGTVTNIAMTGSYGDVGIASVQKGDFTVKYTNLSLGSLGQSLLADISYGSILVENLKSSFSNMSITSGYAPVKIRGAVPCKVDITGKYFDADLGPDFIVKNKNTEGSSKQISGYKLTERTNATIKIDTRYGDVTIK